ncbi:hypothetical protein B9Z39_00280 [Limnohabitans sp. JirII-29]|uniref:restriction endonuclease subunit S n=1 Tax=Limnohabitans sp. JirII-29 TaxID=1835756 RepID=UPI000D3D79FB|nr:restriction endonuclease subunit S [Limnohabitans sp. JirII-29]PUE30010.1 hypothetical protein B9Z39_00280 [Limnohabitans sp. JirII-29]
MSTEEKKTQVPMLRFPEFLEADAWVKGKLIDTADRSIKWSFIGGPFGSNLKSSDYVETGVRIIQLQNIGDGEFFDDYRIFTTVGKADELRSNNIYPGEIIMSKMGDPVGRACLIPNLHDRYVMCSDGIRLVVNEKIHAKYFVYSLINSPRFRATVEKTATGSTRKRIGLDELKNLPMLLPTKGEQQKIAECLSSLDELIVAQGRKVDALKTHKKGLMQQLFPREGETQPRLRFPEFQNAEGWSSDALGNLFDTSSGGTPDRTKGEFWNGNVPWITTSLVGSSVIMYADEFISDEGLKNSSAKVFPEKTILMAMYGQGKTRGQVAMLGIKAATNQACAAILPRDEIDPLFVFLNLASRYEELRGLSNSGGQENLSQGLIQGLQFSYPGDKAEQQRIGSCLSSLDALITAATRELDVLKTHKKGLMQQLFPSAQAFEA